MTVSGDSVHTDQGYINFQEGSSECEEEEKKEENLMVRHYLSSIDTIFALVEIILALVEITLALVEITLALVAITLALVGIIFALIETILSLVDIIILYSLLVDNSSSTQKAADSRNSRL